MGTIKNKKFNKNLIKIIIMLIIIALLVVLFLHLNKLTKSEKYIGKLLYEGINNVNYIDKIDDVSEYSLKNEYKTIISDKVTIYNNYETKEGITISDEEKKIYVYENDGIEASPYCATFSDYFGNEEYEYEYEGKEKVNGKKCVKVSFTCKTTGNDESQLVTRFWINKKTKTYVKIAHLILKDGEESLLDEKEYDMCKGNVKESDVSKPDINSYKDYTIVEGTDS